MTDRELEDRLRAWYDAEVGDVEPAPSDLRERLTEIPASAPAPLRQLPRRRGITLLAAAALLLVGGAVAAGSGLVRFTEVVPPTPSDAAARHAGADAVVVADAITHGERPAGRPHRVPRAGRDANGLPLQPGLMRSPAGVDRRFGRDGRARALPRWHRPAGAAGLVPGRVPPAVHGRREALARRAGRRPAAGGRHRLCSPVPGDAVVVPAGHPTNLLA